MENELEKEKIKRAVLALMDLKQAGLYDYYHGVHGSDRMVKTDKYGWDTFQVDDLIYSLEEYLEK